MTTQAYYTLDLEVVLSSKADHDELRRRIEQMLARFEYEREGKTSIGFTGHKLTEEQAFTLIEQRRERALRDAQRTDDTHVEFGGKVHVHKEPD